MIYQIRTDCQLNAGHPVLNVFASEITITNSSNVSGIKQNANSVVNIGVSLSRTLNTQEQNGSIEVYLENTLISTIASSQTVTIPQATLNNLSI